MVNFQKEIQEKLTKNLLDMIILQLLDDHPMCGYEIMSTIRKTHGVYLGASTMYPTLNALDRKKLVKSDWSIDSRRPKKIYKLTHDGQAVLQYSVGSLSQICKTLNNVGNNKYKHVEIGVIIE